MREVGGNRNLSLIQHHHPHPPWRTGSASSNSSSSTCLPSGSLLRAKMSSSCGSAAAAPASTTPPPPVTMSGPLPTRLMHLSGGSVSGNDSVDTRSSIPVGGETEIELGPEYNLQPQDVVCGGRGMHRATGNNVGNERFRVIVKVRLADYIAATSRKQKIRIIKEIVESVRQSGGKFVRHENGTWFDVGDIKAREKAGTLIRYLVSRSGTGSASDSVQSDDATTSSSPSTNGVRGARPPPSARNRTTRRVKSFSYQHLQAANNSQRRTTSPRSLQAAYARMGASDSCLNYQHDPARGGFMDNNFNSTFLGGGRSGLEGLVIGEEPSHNSSAYLNASMDRLGRSDSCLHFEPDEEAVQEAAASGVASGIARHSGMGIEPEPPVPSAAFLNARLGASDSCLKFEPDTDETVDSTNAAAADAPAASFTMPPWAITSSRLNTSYSTLDASSSSLDYRTVMGTPSLLLAENHAAVNSSYSTLEASGRSLDYQSVVQQGSSIGGGGPQPYGTAGSTMTNAAMQAMNSKLGASAPSSLDLYAGAEPAPSPVALLNSSFSQLGPVGGDESNSTAMDLLYPDPLGSELKVPDGFVEFVKTTFLPPDDKTRRQSPGDATKQPD